MTFKKDDLTEFLYRATRIRSAPGWVRRGACLGGQGLESETIPPNMGIIGTMQRLSVTGRLLW